MLGDFSVKNMKKKDVFTIFMMIIRLLILTGHFIDIHKYLLKKT